MKDEPVQIAIVSPHYLRSCGLKTILIELFSVDEVDLFENIYAFAETTGMYDRIFVDTVIYLSGSDLFKDKKKVVLLSDVAVKDISHSEFSFLNIHSNKKELIADLDSICSNILADRVDENGKDLTEREREVLELVAKGFISKDIAAKLNISLYTVQAHRKNISGKLGIKSVSALTVYAMMNGIVNY